MNIYVKSSKELKREGILQKNGKTLLFNESGCMWQIWCKLDM